MSDSHPPTDGNRSRRRRRNFALRRRWERYRVLCSAWDVLATSAGSAEQQRIADTRRSLDDTLAKLAKQHPKAGERRFEKLDPRLDSFEHEMRSIAEKVPVAQLRSSLPERVVEDRRGVLALLDLLLGAETLRLEGTAARIGAIDYLITLLCTTSESSDAVFPQDPVTLTPQLTSLCAQPDRDRDPRLPEIEAEFFAAADRYGTEVGSSDRLHELTRRKMELGSSYFAPGVLRSIVAYNATLSRHRAQEVESSKSPAAADRKPNGVFESPAICELARALRRRATGGAPHSTAIDRIAWCLDLSYLNRTESAALLAASVGLREDLEGTTILVGLLSRSAVVLEDELPAIGISAQQLSAVWVPELDAALKQASQEQITGDSYRKACHLSEMRNKFLCTPIVPVHHARLQRAPAPPAKRDAIHTKRTARKIVREALEAKTARPAVGLAAWRTWPWARLARVAGAAAVAAVCGLVIASLRPAAGIEPFSREELQQVSPLLAGGGRSGQGVGPAFVGTLDERWSALAADEQHRAAASLVAGLRARGVSQVMVYDAARGLRIQALGANPVRVVPARGRD